MKIKQNGNNIEGILNEIDHRCLEKGRTIGEEYGENHEFKLEVHMINPHGLGHKNEVAEFGKKRGDIYINYKTLENTNISESDFSKELGNLITMESNNNIHIKLKYYRERLQDSAIIE